MAAEEEAGGFGAPSNCLGAERQDGAPRHGLPGEREDRRKKNKGEEIPPLRGLAGALLEREVDECVCVWMERNHGEFHPFGE